MADFITHDADSDERLVRDSLRAAFPQPQDELAHLRGEHLVRETAAALRRDHAALDRSEGINTVPFRRSRRMAACAGTVLTLLAGSSGVAAASSGATPGEMLYPVKHVVERAWVLTAASDLKAARLELRFAERRLDENNEIIARGGDFAQLPRLREAFIAHLEAAERLAGSLVSDQIVALRARWAEAPQPSSPAPASPQTEAAVREAPERRASPPRSEPQPHPTPGRDPQATQAAPSLATSAPPTPEPASAPTPTVDPSYRSQSPGVRADGSCVPTSEEPVQVPAADPTTEPTADPTADPTTEPTADPTTEPTADPTADPTTEPTAEPTGPEGAELSPTDEPTPSAPEVRAGSPEQATGTPTPVPSTEPLEEATAEPACDRSEEVTEGATQAPTEAPTGIPTEVPTRAGPGDQPDSSSAPPAQSPTGAPAFEPSAGISGPERQLATRQPQSISNTATSP